MGGKKLESHRYYTGLVLQLLVIVAVIRLNDAFPADDDRFLDRGFSNPGAHQLASWLISQLRHAEYAQEMPNLPYGPPGTSKRNSELTSSIMGIPRTMIDNGKK